MKKLALMLIALATLASCGNRASSSAEVDAVDSTVVESVVDSTIAPAVDSVAVADTLVNE